MTCHKQIYTMETYDSYNILLYKVICPLCIYKSVCNNPPCVTSNTQNSWTNIRFIVTHRKLGLTPCQWSKLKAILMAKIGAKL